MRTSKRTHFVCISDCVEYYNLQYQKVLISHEMCFIFCCLLHFGFDCSDTLTDTHSRWVASSERCDVFDIIPCL